MTEGRQAAFFKRLPRPSSLGALAHLAKCNNMGLNDIYHAARRARCGSGLLALRFVVEDRIHERLATDACLFEGNLRQTETLAHGTTWRVRGRLRAQRNVINSHRWKPGRRTRPVSWRPCNSPLRRRHSHSIHHHDLRHCFSPSLPRHPRSLNAYYSDMTAAAIPLSPPRLPSLLQWCSLLPPPPPWFWTCLI